jgi:lipopolysaccharide export system permease protein
MLFHSSIRKELARSFSATLVVLSTIVMTVVLVRALGLASRGSINPSEVVMVMGFTVLGQMPTLLGLSLFIAIVNTLSRMYSDSEMVIWLASGRGLANFLPTLLRFAWPIFLVVAVLALLIWPWTNQRIIDLQARYEQRGDIERVAPGQFQESADGSRVFFMDKDSPDKNTGNNVFITVRTREGDSLITARVGHIDTTPNGRFLMLEHGQRLENQHNADQSLKVSEFEVYGIKLPDDVLKRKEAVPSKSLSTWALLIDPTKNNLGQLSWRLGLTFAPLNLVLLALVVSNVNPRAGRSGNLIFAFLAFITYHNLTILGQSWISNGRYGLGGYLLVVHGGTLLLGLLALAVRHHNGSLRSLLQWRVLNNARPQA